MTRQAIREYIEAIRKRCLRAKRREKGRILDEAMQVTGYHRKALVRLLHRERRAAAGRRGRPRRYGPEVREALRVVCEASDHLCSKRPKPFLPELVSAMTEHGS